MFGTTKIIGNKNTLFDFSYACKMQCPLNLVLESWEYAILDCGLKLHKLY